MAASVAALPLPPAAAADCCRQLLTSACRPACLLAAPWPSAPCLCRSSPGTYPASEHLIQDASTPGQQCMAIMLCRLVCWAWRSRSSSCAVSLIRDGAPLMRCSGGGLCRKRRHQMRISMAAVAPLCGRLIPCSLPAWAASPLQSRCTCRAAWHGWPLAWRQAERARHCGTRNMKLHLGISRIAIASAGL